MSSEEEIKKSLGNDSESIQETEKRSIIAYTRDFLLSLRELEVCKKLPSGFDESLLSDFGDGYHGTMPSYRRSDVSSSPPIRGDSSNYSRGAYNRWDSRSSIRSDKDSDSQSDKDSDSGRSYGNQSWKSWQSSEHDGLLGSGSFSRPPGFAAGLSGPKGRSNDQYQLKRSNEPYHPPRPYKAGPISRREITDSLNDETFGSAECSNQDRSEEERKRRESFELMRKEQHKTLQEKQSLTKDKPKKDDSTNITELTGESGIGNTTLGKVAELDDSVKQSVSNSDSSKPSAQTSVVRPLVPPGFKSTVLEKNASIPLAHSRALEAPGVEARISHPKTIVQNDILENQERLVAHKTPEKRDGHIQNFLTNTEIFNEKHSTDNELNKASSLSEESEFQGVSEIVKGDTKKVNGQAQQPSILDKLFESVVSDNLIGSSSLMKKQESKQDDPWNTPNVIQSSKFSQWFEDEKKGTEDLPNAGTNNLLSLIGGGDIGGSQASDVKSPQHFPTEYPFPGSKITDGHLVSDTLPSTVGLPKKLSKSSKETSPPILTCEDLEQTILSEYSERSSTFEGNLHGQNVFSPEEPKVESDNQASQHLLSLLQQGPVLKDSTVPSIMETGFSAEKVDHVTQSGKPLTLETLFGSAFMKELQSAEAPVSALGNAVKANTNRASNVDEKHRLQSKSDNFGGWFGNQDTQVGSNSSKTQSDILVKHDGIGGELDIQLPEEESLIAAGDPVITQNSMFNTFGNSINGESQSFNRPLDISDKLAALGTSFKDERPLMRGPHGSVDHEFPFHNHPAPQMNHASPFLHPLESRPIHASPQMNFNGGMIQHGGPSHSNHQFPANMARPLFRHPSGGQAGFDPPHPMLQQMKMQMQIQRQTPNNIPHHLQESNTGAPVPPHLRNHAAGLIQEHNYMQGLSFDQQQANYVGPGMTMQVPEVSSNHPEAFQKLLEMELRANSSKHMHPIASLGNSNQGLHGHDIDTSFHYR